MELLKLSLLCYLKVPYARLMGGNLKERKTV